MRRLLILALSVVAVSACGSAVASPSPTDPVLASHSAAASPSPAAPLLARGSFLLYGAQVELDAAGSGNSVTGSMTVSDEANGFRVDLKCARTTTDGVILIAGDITESTSVYARKGAREVIVLKPGSPVYASFDSEGRSGGDVLPAASCPALLQQVIDTGTQTVIGDNGLEPIEGTVEFGS